MNFLLDGFFKTTRNDPKRLDKKATKFQVVLKKATKFQVVLCCFDVFRGTQDFLNVFVLLFGVSIFDS